MNKQIYVFYDARPLIQSVKAYLCEIIKYTKTGFKIKNIDEPGEYEDVIFKSDGTARGWRTLSWLSVYDIQAQSDYKILRERMRRDEAATAN